MAVLVRVNEKWYLCCTSPDSISVVLVVLVRATKKSTSVVLVVLVWATEKSTSVVLVVLLWVTKTLLVLC